MKIKHLILIILSLILVVPVVYADDYQDGVDAFDKKDFKAALKKLKPLAEKGHAKAQNKLGEMYGNGKGFHKTTKKHSSGIDFQQNKVMHLHNSTWV